MKAVIFYFRNLESTQILHRFILPFLTFMVDLTFGKILNIATGRVTVGKFRAIAHAQKVSFIQTHRGVPFKR